MWEEKPNFFGWGSATFQLLFWIKPHVRAVSIWMRFKGIYALLTYQNIYLVHFSTTSFILLTSRSL